MDGGPRVLRAERRQMGCVCEKQSQLEMKPRVYSQYQRPYQAIGSKLVRLGALWDPQASMDTKRIRRRGTLRW